MKTEEYRGLKMTIPQTREEALEKMEAEKRAYEQGFRERNINLLMSGFLPMLYEYDRKKAIELGAKVSDYPEELNYLEMRN